MRNPMIAVEHIVCSDDAGCATTDVACFGFSSVMAGLAPAIHAFYSKSKTWMPGTRPGMTEEAPKRRFN
jgi:hypothetical protein